MPQSVKEREGESATRGAAIALARCSLCVLGCRVSLSLSLSVSEVFKLF